jgi:hypothetical protein
MISAALHHSIAYAGAAGVIIGAVDQREADHGDGHVGGEEVVAV